MKYKFRDKLVTKTSKRRITDEGYLDLPARLSRVGVQQYLAGEIGVKDVAPNTVLNIYRPPEEVFNEDSLASFENKPVTDDHPPEKVTAKNNKKYSVGSSYGSVSHDDTYVNASLLITDQSMIEKIEQGKAEVSNGYRADLVFGKDKTPEGITYDAKQVDIRGNHIAIVMRGRAGRNVRLSDNQKVKTVKVNINDVNYDIEDGPAAEAVNKLVSDKKAVETTVKDNDAAHQTELGKKDSEIEKLKKENKELKDAKPNVEKLVADRVKFAAAVATVDKDFVIGDKDELTVKRELLLKHREGLTLDDKTDAGYVNGAFDILVTDIEKAGRGNTLLDSAINDAHTGGAPVIKDADGKIVDTRSPDVIAREKMINDNRTAFGGAT